MGVAFVSTLKSCPLVHENMPSGASDDQDMMIGVCLVRGVRGTRAQDWT
jgi:hypothetical protein